MSDENKKEVSGRPTLYTQELANEIASIVATNGCSLAQMCRERPHWPDRATIYRWLQRYPLFCDAFARAKIAQTDVLADDAIDISDDSFDDEDVDKIGNRRINREFVERSKLRVTTRLTLAQRLNPAKYGIKNIITGSDGESLKIETKLTAQDRERKVTKLLANIASRIKQS